ncbi:hypothetical protein GGE07_001536 [Sinorhizobium terangae]|uniref:DUF6538 domain-containing protein n=1 Tax=Sinorhizobium terangae TaxID=110322 RepID=UPI0017F82529|nr:DUF6538 domain-containing protein [Sinorhizobium terangae]MBB4184907.1 hypothetical protein [Sinorhizobium terangae]
MRVPLELVEMVGKKELVKALGTKDETVAKRLLGSVVRQWEQHFDDLRARRALTADDKADAVWQHYNASLQRDEQTRRAMPTPSDIEAEERKVWSKIDAGEISSRDFVGMINANTELELLRSKRAHDANLRKQRLNALKRHLITGETFLIEDAAKDYIETNRLLIEVGSDDYRDLCLRMMRSDIEHLERTFERDQGNYSGAPKDPIVKPATGTARESAAPGETIMELFEVYAGENPKSISADTLNQARRDVGTFVDHVGNTCPAHRIDKKAVREWKALLMKYPVKATETKAFEGMKIAQIVKHNEKVGKPVLTPRTVNRYLSSLGAFCSWLVAHGYIEPNPTDGMSLAKDKKKKVFPFTTDQMNPVQLAAVHRMPE